MADTLVIVESPAKSKKIQTLLGPGYRVSASVGHMRDLPLKDLGVDLTTYKPTYEISPGKKQVVDQLRRLAKTADEVILATDPDREGEAIAWHLKVALGLPDSVKRVSYKEITASAIKRAMDSPGVIDTKLVAAQEARRVLDRLIGYLVSPALSNQAGISLSAGRVQSVAVKFVVDREREIQAHVPRGYQVCSLRIEGQPSLIAQLDLKPFVEDGEKLWKASDARTFTGPQQVTLTDVTRKPVTVPPRPPFTTVALQGAAGKLFGLTAKEVMAAAQSLFEQGHITYHRTDYPNLSEEGRQKIIDYLTSKGAPVAETPHTFKTKADAQEAHEAIRPSDVALTQAGQTDTEKRVYELIRERAVLSVMPSGVDATAQMVFRSQRQVAGKTGRPVHPCYEAQGRVIQEPGWRQFAAIEVIQNKDKALPDLEQGTVFNGSVSSKEEMTKPPSRYNEQTLIKAMESKGIGRPSTYAAILDNIKSRLYIIPENPKAKNITFIPGKSGFYIVDALKALSFMDFKYTRAVESSLDKIAKGDMGYLNLVKPVGEQLQVDVREKIQGDPLALTGRCPGCDKPILQRKAKQKGRMFWVHRNEEDAEGCVKYLNDNNDVAELPAPTIEAPCPTCKNTLVRKQGKNSNCFWVHIDKAHERPCGTTFFNDDAGIPVIPPVIPTAHCVECNGLMKRRVNSKTHQPIWVHDAKQPKCGKKFIDDANGVPANAVGSSPASGDGAA